MKMIMIVLMLAAGCSFPQKPSPEFKDSDGWHGISIRYLCEDGRWYFSPPDCDNQNLKDNYRKSKGYVDMSPDEGWQSEEERIFKDFVDAYGHGTKNEGL